MGVAYEVLGGINRALRGHHGDLGGQKAGQGGGDHLRCSVISIDLLAVQLAFWYEVVLHRQMIVPIAHSVVFFFFQCFPFCVYRLSQDRGSLFMRASSSCRKPIGSGLRAARLDMMPKEHSLLAAACFDSNC